ncbi:PAS domain S-box [Beggiatoa alba B18LD]|uniref:histidine kinase n=1 Tax=Beggiatoa alba B18LD TaxID=395493 RepID=I3CK28_9GAMM|nr:response regulator [Beggiatoa alba]EIJ43971.1 PAS domain S-box [Beggiatoa alba B18LD]
MKNNLLMKPYILATILSSYLALLLFLTDAKNTTNNLFVFSLFLVFSLILTSIITFFQQKEKNYILSLKTQLNILQVAVNNVPLVIWQINQQGIIQFSAGQLDTFHTTANPLQGTSIFKAYEALPTFLQDIQSAIARRLQYKQLNLEQSKQNYDIYYIPLNDNELLIIACDITPSLHKAQRYLQHIKYQDILLQHVTDGFCVANEHNIISHINLTLCQLTGYSKEELQGQSVSRIIRQGGNSDLPYIQWTGELIHKQGHSVHAFINRFIVRQQEDDPQKSLICYFAQDLTRYKQLESELYQIREMLETSQRAKSTFINIINQGIRTPLNNIIGTTELLLKSPIEPRQQRYSVETIRESSENLLHFFNDILVFSRIETGQLSQELSTIDIHAVIEDLLGQSALAIQRKDLIFGCQFSFAATHLFSGDIDQLRQIVSNLLGYAIKSTQQGSILLKVDLLEETEKNVKLHITLNSHGLINSFVLEDLLSTTPNMDATTHYNTDNLSIMVARHLIDVMGGTFSFYQQTEDQSTLWFDVVLQKTQIVNTTLGSAEQRAKLHNKHVLLVELNPLYRQLINEQLQLWHIQVDYATTVTECLDKLLDAVALRQTYDVVLIDSRLPYLDGMQLSQIIHANPQVSNIPLIILMPEGQDYHTAAVLNEYVLHRPVMPSKLLQHLFSSIFNKVDIMNIGAVSPVVREKCILLAEDNLINQEVMKDMLLQLNCQVTVVNNGEEALQALTQHRYDLIFMDCQMPKMDGYQATEQIRRQEKQHKNNMIHVPIIAVTANAINGARERCFMAGMDDYLSKPINSHDLERMLMRYCGFTYVLTQETSVLAINKLLDHHEHEFIEDETISSSSHLVSINTQEDVLSANIIETMRIDMQKRGINWLIDLFLTEFPRYQAAVYEAIVMLDKDLFYQAVHKLKGGAASVGSVSLVNFCKRLETLSKQNNLNEAAELVEKYLAMECSILETALLEEKKKGK